MKRIWRLKTQGFSLVEVAIIISMVAALLATYASWQEPNLQNDSQKVLQTREKMAVINEAISKFVALNDRLPCPADPSRPITKLGTNSTYTYDSKIFPNEAERIPISSAVGGNRTMCKSRAGALPTKSLGLDNTYQLDGWGRKFMYVVSNNLCGDTGAGGNACTAGTFLNSSNVGDLTVNTVPSGSAIVTNAAYVLISYGANGGRAYLPSGTRLSDSSNTYEQENTDATTTSGEFNFANNTFNTGAMVHTGNTASDFSHIVTYFTKNDLLSSKNDVTRHIASLADCQDNRTYLKKISRTTTASYIAQSDLDSAYSTVNFASPTSGGGAAALEVMWILQDICYQLYPASSIDGSDSNPGCPGGATYDSTNKYCSCAGRGYNGSC